MWLVVSVSDNVILDYELLEGKNCILSSKYLSIFNAIFNSFVE